MAGTPTPKPAARDAVGVARSQSPVFGSTTPAPQPMAISALGLLLALGLPLLLTRWGRAWAQGRCRARGSQRGAGRGPDSLVLFAWRGGVEGGACKCLVLRNLGSWDWSALWEERSELEYLSCFLGRC